MTTRNSSKHSGRVCVSPAVPTKRSTIRRASWKLHFENLSPCANSRRRPRQLRRTGVSRPALGGRGGPDGVRANREATHEAPATAPRCFRQECSSQAQTVAISKRTGVRENYERAAQSQIG